MGAAVTEYLQDLKYIIPMVLFIVAAGVFRILWDRQKARYIDFQTVMELYLRKALRDRNDKVRIPAAQVAAMFELETRTITPVQKAGVEHRHPATQPPNRGKG